MGEHGEVYQRSIEAMQKWQCKVMPSSHFTRHPSRVPPSRDPAADVFPNCQPPSSCCYTRLRCAISLQVFNSVASDKPLSHLSLPLLVPGVRRADYIDISLVPLAAFSPNDLFERVTLANCPQLLKNSVVEQISVLLCLVV